MVLTHLMLLWVFLTDVFIMIQLHKNQHTVTTIQVVITYCTGDITAFIVDDPDAVFLMDADAALVEQIFTRTTLLQIQQV